MRMNNRKYRSDAPHREKIICQQLCLFNIRGSTGSLTAQRMQEGRGDQYGGRVNRQNAGEGHQVVLGEGTSSEWG